jgi:REP element-mobilizing transposase RayT
MPDHLHWLFQLVDSRSLSTSVNAVKSFSARRINALTGSAGRVWQKGFHDHGIRRDEDLETIARYIVANPVRARLVRRIADYPHWDAIWL